MADTTEKAKTAVGKAADSAKDTAKKAADKATPSRKKTPDTPLSARAVATDDGTVLVSFGHVVPVEEFEEGQDEHEFDEQGKGFELSVDAALELAAVLPTAAQDAAARVNLQDRTGLVYHDADAKAISDDEGKVVS